MSIYEAENNIASKVAKSERDALQAPPMGLSYDLKAAEGVGTSRAAQLLVADPIFNAFSIAASCGLQAVDEMACFARLIAN